MPTTLESVRRALQQEEISYPELAHELGPASIPSLQTIVSGDDVLLASKAAYVAGLIQDPASAALVAGAAKSDSPAVRVAAAATSPLTYVRADGPARNSRSGSADSPTSAMARPVSVFFATTSVASVSRRTVRSSDACVTVRPR